MRRMSLFGVLFVLFASAEMPAAPPHSKPGAADQAASHNAPPERLALDVLLDDPWLTDLEQTDPDAYEALRTRLLGALRETRGEPTWRCSVFEGPADGELLCLLETPAGRRPSVGHARPAPRAPTRPPPSDARPSR